MRLIDWLLRLLPRSFRDEYAEEIRATVEDQWSEVRGSGWRTRMTFWWRQSLALAALRMRVRSAGTGHSGWATLKLELREAARSVTRRPWSSGATAVVLAFCIGTATVAFSLVDGILRRPLPYPAAEDVVQVRARWLDGRQSSGYVSAAEYLEIGSRTRVFESVGAVDHVERTLLGQGAPVELPGALVSSSTFDVLAVPPMVGRTFTAAEDLPGGGDVVVLSYDLWRDAFGGDTRILGRVVRLGGRGYEVIGVMPEEFVLPTEAGALDPSAFFLPLAVDPADPGPIFVKELEAVVARLARSIDLDRANADVERIASQIASEHPDNYRPNEWTLAARSPVAEATAAARPTLMLLAAAVALLVLAVCANLAGILATRAESRRRDIAVRFALGARRGHVVRVMMIEGVLLAVLGGVAGVVAAAYAMPLVRLALAETFPRMRTVGLDVRVAAATLLAFVATALLFSIRPALRQAGTGAAGTVGLAGVRVSAGRSRARFRRMLIAGQIAIATVLLCGSLLFARSLDRLDSIDPGFDATGVQTIELSLPASAYPTASDVEQFYARLVDDLAAAPAIAEVGIARRRPMADRYGTWTVAIRRGGESRRVDDDPPRWQVASPGYFRAMRIDVAEGRLYSDGEVRGPPGIAVVNRAFADHYWPGQSVLGTQVRMDGGPDNPWLTVVGVVADVLTDGPRGGSAPVLYVPHAHFAAATSTGPARSMSLVLRTSLDAQATRDLARSRLAALDPDLPHGTVRPMTDIVAASFTETRILTRVLTLFACLALLLGCLGVYAALAQEVSARSRELGIRSALGAGSMRIAGSVVLEGAAVAAAGAAIGTGAALLAAKAVAAHLFGIGPRDPVTFTAVPLLLLFAAVAASWLPARRAAGADPMIPLRAE